MADTTPNDGKAVGSNIVAGIGTLVWPVVAVIAMILYRAPLSRLIEPPTQGEAHFKVGSIVDIDRVSSSAANAGIQAGIALAQSKAPFTSTQVADAAAKISQSLTTAPAQISSTPKILWIDENPQNNYALTLSFEDLGILVEQVTTNAAALAKLSTTNFDMVITSHSRSNGDETGELLANDIHQLYPNVPIIIYAAVWALQNQNQAQRYHALAITDDPAEVYSLVLKTLHVSPQ